MEKSRLLEQEKDEFITSMKESETSAQAEYERLMQVIEEVETESESTSLEWSETVNTLTEENNVLKKSKMMFESELENFRTKLEEREVAGESGERCSEEETAMMQEENARLKNAQVVFERELDDLRTTLEQERINTSSRQKEMTMQEENTRLKNAQVVFESELDDLRTTLELERINTSSRQKEMTMQEEKRARVETELADALLQMDALEKRLEKDLGGQRCCGLEQVHCAGRLGQILPGIEEARSDHTG